MSEYRLCDLHDWHPTRIDIAVFRESGDPGQVDLSLDVFALEQVAFGGEYDEYLKSDRWQVFRQAVIKNQHGHCALCMDDATHVHHRTYRRCGIERNEDCVALCRRCHDALHIGREFARKALKRSPR